MSVLPTGTSPWRGQAPRGRFCSGLALRSPQSTMPSAGTQSEDSIGCLLLSEPCGSVLAWDAPAKIGPQTMAQESSLPGLTPGSPTADEQTEAQKCPVTRPGSSGTLNPPVTLTYFNVKITNQPWPTTPGSASCRSRPSDKSLSLSEPQFLHL